MTASPGWGMLILKVEINMYVCLCFAVNDRSVRRHAREGAASIEEVGRRCGAGTGCGGCHRHIRRILDEETAALADNPGDEGSLAAK